MTTRLALLDMVARHRLDKTQASALWRLAGFDGAAPQQLPARLRLGVTLLGAGCAGLGLIFWVAANWSLLSRLQQFSLLQALVLAPCVAVAACARGRAAFSLLALIATGGLFAYFGQTYQTGADPWQLFAVWAALSLPLALCARSDAVWSAWAIVALTGVTLWNEAHGGFGWRSGAAAVGAGMVAVGCGAGLTVLLGKVGRRYTGAGDWTFGIALVLTAILATIAAVSDLVQSMSPSYWFCLVLAGAAAALIAHGKPFDVFSASVVGLVLNVLLFAGMAVLLSHGPTGDGVGMLMLLGVIAALMLAATVSVIIRLARTSAAQGEQA